MRCVHEAKLYPHNCFITLTYNNENLPEDNSLDKSHFQLFMKRLRDHISYHYNDRKIRYFHCGEYGEQLGRPHYHALLFNYDFNDKILHRVTPRGDKLYTSPTLEKLWGKGFATIGDANFETAAYVARYVTKKITGPNSFEHYTKYDRDSGEIITDLLPEYTTMSRRPGIGRAWLEKYLSDVYPDDFVLLRGKKLKPPKAYDNFHKIIDPFTHDEIKERRELAGKLHTQDSTPSRLATREIIQQEKIKILKRNYEK